jgi:hypothetical protein
MVRIYLGRTEEAITVAEDHTLSWRSDSKVSQVNACLSRSEDDNGLVATKLLALLEVRRVLHNVNVVCTRQNWHIGSNVQAGADSNGIAFIGYFSGNAISTSLMIVDDMATSTTTAYRQNRSGEVDLRPQVEVVTVVSQVPHIAFSREEVRVVLERSKVRERGEELG